MTNYNRFNDKALRQKTLSEMSEAEKALLQIEVDRAFENLKSKYRNEGNTMLALAQRLREEAGRLLYSGHSQQEKPKATPKEAPVSYGRTSLFEE
jgi:hypothetical protein